MCWVMQSFRRVNGSSLDLLQFPNSSTISSFHYTIIPHSPKVSKVFNLGKNSNPAHSILMTRSYGDFSMDMFSSTILFVLKSNYRILCSFTLGIEVLPSCV